MKNIDVLFKNNRIWARQMRQQDPAFFKKLAHVQSPKYLWIGCSDSRVPANRITGLLPGELFVHRNIGNIVAHTDLNCLSVLQFAVEILKINHVIVCGHYGCGGVRAAFEGNRLGLVDNWLRHISDVKKKFQGELNKIKNKKNRFNRLCELNVYEQANNLCQTTIIQDIWKKGRKLTVHPIIYDLNDGLLKKLGSINAQNLKKTPR